MPTFGNCWTYAIPKWWRDGGYIVVRRSGFMRVPHVLWVRSLDGVEFHEFTPISPKFRGLSGFARAFFHRGFVRTITESGDWGRAPGVPWDVAMIVYFVGCGALMPFLFVALMLAIVY
jgi:hypothetical protein